MKWQVLVRPEAERDLAKVRDWYEQKRAGLGDEFLGRFPYKIFYQVVAERIVVFRVLHGKRDHGESL